MKLKYTKEILQDAVNKSISIAGVLRELNISWTGGSHAHIAKRIKYFNIDISHFKGQAYLKGKQSYKKLSFDKILINRTTISQNRQKTFKLKRALLESGMEYKCNKCNIKDWNNKTIVLEINHKNENYLDDTKDNLEFLCPNCHSQYKAP